MNMHDPFTDRLSDYLDGELGAPERRALEQHLTGCQTCRNTLSELRAVVAHAAALTDTAPEGDLWRGVAERIGPGRNAQRRFSFTFSFTLPQLAAAVLAVMVLSGAALWMARLGGDRTDFPPVDARAQRADDIDASVHIRPANFADAAYDEAIADLQETLRTERTRLDAETVRVLQANLQAIDAAIEQCREALASDPANVYLNSHLADAKRRKLSLLRRASALAQTES
jgi:tetratricopeptide (TPR) repeat protein